MKLLDRVRSGAAYAVDSGGLSGATSGKSPYDRYPLATRPDRKPPVTFRDRIAALGERKEYEGGGP